MLYNTILTTNPADTMLREMVNAASCTPSMLPVTKLPISNTHHSPPTTNTPGIASQRNSFHSLNDSKLKPEVCMYASMSPSFSISNTVFLKHLFISLPAFRACV